MTNDELLEELLEEYNNLAPKKKKEFEDFGYYLLAIGIIICDMCDEICNEVDDDGHCSICAKKYAEKHKRR